MRGMLGCLWNYSCHCGIVNELGQFTLVFVVTGLSESPEICNSL